jgi:hypothetical protein
MGPGVRRATLNLLVFAESFAGKHAKRPIAAMLIKSVLMANFTVITSCYMLII